MKILIVGDPHGALPKKIPKNLDLILMTGDIGKADLARQRFFENIERKKKGLPEKEYDKTFTKQVHQQIHNSTLKALRYLSRFAPVYTLAGNVGISTKVSVREDEKEYGIKLSATMPQIDKMKNVHVVKNRLRVLNGLRIGFLEYFIDTSWIKEFKPKDYRVSLKKAKKETEKAKRVLRGFGDVDILICHQPPYGVLDKVNFPGIPASWKGKHAGSKAVLDYIKKSSPKYVFCGHIHEAKGKKRIGKSLVQNVGSSGDYAVLTL